MIERVKRWLVRCRADLESLVGKLERPNARRPRNLCVFLFVCDLFVDRGQPASKEKAEDAARKSHEHRPKITEKPIENHRKIDQNRGKIGKKSFLGHFGRPKLFRGRAGTRSGLVRDTQKPPRGGSWGRWGRPRTAKSRPKPGPSRSQDTPVRLRSNARA